MKDVKYWKPYVVIMLQTNLLHILLLKSLMGKSQNWNIDCENRKKTLQFPKDGWCGYHNVRTLITDTCFHFQDKQHHKPLQ